jgi:endoglucanase
MDHPGFHVASSVHGQPADALVFKGGLMAEHARPGSPLHFFRRGERDPVGEGVLTTADADANGRLIGGRADRHEGDFAMWGFPGWSIADGKITARVCDDLLGCAAILAVLDEIAASRASTCVWGLFTRAEEEGFLGAFEAIRLGTVPKDADVLSLECSKALPHAPQGGGVIVRVGDRMSIFDPSLTAALEAAATTVDGLRSQRRLMDGGACEATAFCAAGYRAGGLALPLVNYHNMSGLDGGEPGIGPETIRVSDFAAEVRLLLRLAELSPRLPELERGAEAWIGDLTRTARKTLSAAPLEGPDAPRSRRVRGPASPRGGRSRRAGRSR